MKKCGYNHKIGQTLLIVLTWNYCLLAKFNRWVGSGNVALSDGTFESFVLANCELAEQNNIWEDVQKKHRKFHILLRQEEE